MKRHALWVGILVLSLIALSGCGISRIPSWLLSASTATPVPTVTPAAVSAGSPVGAIAALDRQPVAGMEDLQALLRQAEPGQKATLTVLREGKEVQVNVNLGAQPTGRP